MSSKNYNEYTAPEGYYYHKDDLYAKVICLPLSVSIDEFELVTEEVYLEQEAKMKEEMEKIQEKMNQ